MIGHNPSYVVRGMLTHSHWPMLTSSIKALGLFHEVTCYLRKSIPKWEKRWSQREQLGQKHLLEKLSQF